MLTERSVLGSAAMVDTTVQFHAYETSVHGQGVAPMELLPETTEGNFFNQQHRHTSAFQWVETASGSHKGPEACTRSRSASTCSTPTTTARAPADRS